MKIPAIHLVLKQKEHAHTIHSAGDIIRSLHFIYLRRFPVVINK